MKTLHYYFFLLLLLPGILRAQDCDRINVTGQGEAIRKPDVAYVTVYIKESGMLAEDAIKKADKKTKDIPTTLEDYSKDIKKIDFTDVRIGQKESHMFSSEDTPKPPSPEFIRKVQVTMVPDSQKVNKVLDLLLRADTFLGVETNVYPNHQKAIVYGLLNSKEALQEAQKKAFQDAYDKVQPLAKRAGLNLYGIKNIGDCSSSPSFSWDESSSLPTEYTSPDPKEIKVSVSLKIGYGVGK